MDIAFAKSKNNFVTAGKNGLIFWSWDGKKLDHKKGTFGTNKMADMFSVAWIDADKCISGATNGQVYIWEANKCTKT
jgi:hypothetical protein